MEIDNDFSLEFYKDKEKQSFKNIVKEKNKLEIIRNKIIQSISSLKVEEEHLKKYIKELNN